MKQALLCLRLASLGHNDAGDVNVICIDSVHQTHQFYQNNLSSRELRRHLDRRPLKHISRDRSKLCLQDDAECSNDLI